MANRKLPDAEYLRNRFLYDEATGKLIWRSRPLSEFPDKRSHKVWNTRFSGTVAGTGPDHIGYYRVSIDNKQFLSHRIIWKLVHGSDPDGIDHINGNSSDNRISNLRAVSQAVNCMNVRRRNDNTSGFSGVYYRKDTLKWSAYVNCGGKRTTIGSFASYEEAVAARVKKQNEMGFTERHGRDSSTSKASVA